MTARSEDMRPEGIPCACCEGVGSIELDPPLQWDAATINRVTCPLCWGAGTSRRPDTIKCECCQGTGWIEKPGSWGVDECPLCSGTGREPPLADTQARRHVEGHKP